MTDPFIASQFDQTEFGRSGKKQSDHGNLAKTKFIRRYFAKFERITAHLARVAAHMEVEGHLQRNEVKLLARYLIKLGYTFKTLEKKYQVLETAYGLGADELTFDRSDSGFPIHAELLQMAADAAQAQQKLAGMASVESIKSQMVRQIVAELRVPKSLQYSLSQRLYYEELARGDLFWPQMHPDVIWLSSTGEGRNTRRRYLMHWAVYDSEINLPTIYMMELEDTGRTALPKDETRWPQVQSHLMAQSMAGLQLVTIATGFDKDFDDLHPKTLRRFYVGPMYSHTFTRQNGPLRDVLAEAKSPPGEDWALAWTVEELKSQSVKQEKSGWFGTVEREIFALDPFASTGSKLGVTNMERAIIMPQRPFQVLLEKSPKGFKDVRKFVVSPAGRVLSHR